VDGFQFGATVTFENFPGATPVASNVVVVDSNTITLDVTVGTNGPNKDRVGDVRVTNPDSSTDSCEDCFTVTVGGPSSAAASNVVTVSTSAETDEALVATGDTSDPATTTDPVPAADIEPLPQPTQTPGSDTGDDTTLSDLAFSDPATLDDPLLGELATALAG
jgi:hypothetical protein